MAATMGEVALGRNGQTAAPFLMLSAKVHQLRPRMRYEGSPVGVEVERPPTDQAGPSFVDSASANHSLGPSRAGCHGPGPSFRPSYSHRDLETGPWWLLR